MNKFQRLVIVGAAMNVLLMLLFPPFSSQPLARSLLPGFEGYYPVFMQFGKQPIHTSLLTLQMMLVGANALLAWLLLGTSGQHVDVPDVRFGRGILLLTIINLLLVLALPPYESFRTLLRSDSGFFEGFYFVLGANYRRTIMWPLLHLECLFIAVNALGHFLLFSVIRDAHGARKKQIFELAESLSPSELEKIAEDLRHRAEGTPAQTTSPIGRHGDRRHESLPSPGIERRQNNDRRGGSR